MDKKHSWKNFKKNFFNKNAHENFIVQLTVQLRLNEFFKYCTKSSHEKVQLLRWVTLPCSLYRVSYRGVSITEPSPLPKTIYPCLPEAPCLLIGFNKCSAQVLFLSKPSKLCKFEWNQLIFKGSYFEKLFFLTLDQKNSTDYCLKGNSTRISKKIKKCMFMPKWPPNLKSWSYA